MGAKGNVIPVPAGTRFGRYVVLEEMERGKRYQRMVRCRCDCGQIRAVFLYNMIKGATQSCGCLSREISSKRLSKPKGESTYRHIFNSYKRGARVRDLEWSLSEPDFRSLLLSDCFYCGTPANRPYKVGLAYRDVVFVNGVDRVDNELGYTLQNTKPCCSVCNRAKMNMPQRAFIEWMDRLVQFRRSVVE